MSTLAPPLQRSPETLLVAAAGGDASAWEQLVRAYTGRVFGLLARQCNNRELAEELTQETFVKLVQVLRKPKTQEREAGGYDEQGKFEPWLFRVAMNCLRDEMRRRSRQAQVMDMSPGAAASAGDGQEASAFAKVEAAQAMRHSDAHDPQVAASTAEQVTLMQAAVAKMSEKERQILHLRHTAGLSFAQIAETLPPLGTILSSAHRALAKLKKDLAYLEA